MSYYIVFSYIPTSGRSCASKYVEGIYKTSEEANSRKNNLHRVDKLSSSIPRTVFINVFPEGDCYIELFTTSTK
jgi:hypothetical protein